MSADTIEQRFESGPNALNFLRLCLALQVLLWHAYALRGDSWLPARLESFLADVAVDSFFAISGFLICRAWLRRPALMPFLRARAVRILPGLWVCLVTTAFVIVPVAAWLSGTESPTWDGRWHYVVANAGVWVGDWGIDGGPAGVAHPGAWNGSLWSLGYEVGCYLVIATLGFCRILRARVVAGLAITFWVMSAQLTLAGFSASGQAYCVVPRCGLMFAAGGFLWLHRDRVPVSRFLIVASVLAVAAGVACLPNYRLVAAPAIGYLCVVFAMRLGETRRLVLRHDLSYGVYVYGFVVQQSLLVCGADVGWLPFAVISMACVAPFAAASWLLVEQPALAHLSRGRNATASPRPVGMNPANVAP